MGNLVRVLSALGVVAALVSTAIATPAPVEPRQVLPPWDFDIDWGQFFARQSFACPLWRGDLPDSAKDLAGSTCSRLTTKTFNQGSITASLYQVPGAWQRSSRYNEIVNGVGDAIKKGLNVFAGLGALPSALQINLGFVSGTLGELVKVDDDNNGIKHPCYILINFPSRDDYPLLALQKDVIKGMYQCIEQYHRPTVTVWTDGNKWWRAGIARYFDGLSYGTNANMITQGLYPEEYSFGITLYQNREAAALFFHFVDGLAGWSPTDVNNWMKSHANTATYNAERTALSTDAKIPSQLFHRFIIACKDRTIKYPNGQKIEFTSGGPLETVHPAVNANNVGSEYSRSVAVNAWKGKTYVFPIKANYKMRVSVEAEPGIEWSIRRVGTAVWSSGDRGRTVDIAAGTSETRFEMIVSSTRDDGGSGLSKVKMTRTA